MTAEPFTEAAGDRADELWPYAPAGIPLSPAKRMDRRVGFRLGAQWAHDYLTAQEPTDAEVEAAARAIYVQRASYHTAASWEREPETVKTLYRRYARAVLSAASAARRDEETR